MANKSQNSNDSLVADPEQAQVTNDELLALHTSQGEVIAEQQARIAELESLVAKLQKGQQAAAPKGGTIVKVGDLEYQVLHGLRIAGKTYSAADIAADAELCERLVSEGSGAFKQL